MQEALADSLPRGRQTLSVWIEAQSTNVHT
jgi:hypothetical protein